MKGVNKAFFGQNCALKIQYNQNTNQVFMHLGKIQENKWTWYKAKLNDVELGKIIQVLEDKTKSLSFFHKFNNKPQQIYVNRGEDKRYIFFKIGSISKSINDAEANVLRTLLTSMIIKLNSHPSVFEIKKKEVKA